ncbi:uncharacterized protein LOC126894989 isoform X3 [Daktulosphaira vitifoliae]|uniref:uncharacterized protein LOC126894989 isoform X2 n=1 Tax=Daktulosphaira vitifoliae TaxID=58002 RepID=UPI0021AACD65|nr:uncharacterized protein LOC126894989 isoform X2 [Daktulosphaira vitifoliae]XP_050522361.1 uncharacterized protein LOC126894989 isoform X3 [Daktulosphaira vitifoliae]
MNFYLFLRIFFCFTCIITIPTFSTAFPCSDEESNNYDSAKSNGSSDEIYFSNEDGDLDNIGTNLWHLSFEDEEKPIKYERFDIYDPSNEINYPLSFYLSQISAKKFAVHSDDKGRITIKKMIDIGHEFEEDPTVYQKYIAGNIVSDDVWISVNSLFVSSFKNFRKFEIQFNEDLLIGDKNKNDTVEKDYAEKIIFNNELFIKNFKKDFLKSVLEKYTNEQNQFKYKEMIKHFYDDIGDIKYVIWTFDKEEDDYVKKYSSNTHDDTHDHKLFLFGFNV